MHFVGKEFLLLFRTIKQTSEKPSFAIMAVQPTPTYIFRYKKTRETY